MTARLAVLAVAALALHAIPILLRGAFVHP